MSLTGTPLRVLPALLVLSVMTYVKSGWEPLKLLFSTMRNGLILSGAAFMGTFLGLLLMSTGAKYAKVGVITAISNIPSRDFTDRSLFTW